MTLPFSHDTATTSETALDEIGDAHLAYLFPASFAQERLWFLHQFEPGSYVYNIPTALRLAGSLNFSALQQSIATLVERHETLRTRFVTVDGRPMQSVALDLTISLPMVDLSATPTDEQVTLTQRIAEEEACRPFDLARGTLIRTTLLRLDTSMYMLLLTFHHTIADAWSLNICFHELNTLYSAFAEGKPISLPELPIQYADYAAWQRDAISHRISDDIGSEYDERAEGDLAHELAYWKKQLTGAPTVLELPSDYPRPAIQTYHGARYQFILPASLTRSLEALSRRQSVTLFMTLLAAFSTFLSRLSGQQDILVGTPIAGRTQIELEELIGFFANTLVMRCDVAAESSFLELLRQVRDVALEAYAHQEIPFDRVVETLQPERSLSYNPIFQVLFSYQNMPQVSSEPTSSALQLEPLDISIATSKFDLSLYFSQDAVEQGGLIGEFEYNTALFEATTIARWATHLQTLLTGIVAYPQQRISTLPLLEATEQQQLLDTWSATTTFPAPNLCLHQLFEAQVERTPHAIALSTATGEHITYAEVNQRANRLAHYLIKIGVGAEKRVAILLDRTPDTIITILAILKAGGAYVPIDPAYPAERITYMLDDVQVTLLITSSAFLDRLPGTIQQDKASLTILYMDRDTELFGNEPESNVDSSVSQDNLAYIIFTSGSTGKPKGVGICHQQVTRLFAATQPRYSFTAQDSWTFFHSMAFDFSVWEIWGGLLYGARLVIVPYWVSRSPVEFVALLAREQVTVLNQTPSAFYALQQAISTLRQEIGLSLRFVIFGGEALDAARLRSWMETHTDTHPQLVNMYGITETTVHVTYYPMNRDVILVIANAGGTSIIGTPLSDLQIYLLDAHMQPVPPGVPGEMYVGGAGLARGYIEHPDLTAARFVPHPFSSEPGARLYKTGDVARFLPDGTFAYQGRADQQVKLRGFRIELGEIEAALTGHPQVQAAAVLLRETNSGAIHPENDQTHSAEEEQQQSGAPTRTLIAYIVPKPAQTPTVHDIRAYLHKLLPEYMIPASFVLLEALPLTANGKLDRRALPAPTSDHATLEKSYLAPHTSVEKSLAKIWSQVLGLQKIGIHDNFFRAGRDFILSIQIVAKANASGLPLTPRHLFQHQTIAQLASAVGATPTAQTEQGQVLGSLLLTPIQHWFFQLSLPNPHHWNQAILLETRQLLDPAVLRQAVQALLIQHDMLRLRAHREPSGWSLTIAALQDDVPFTHIDFSTLPEAQRKPALETAAAHLQASLNLTDGPILRVALFALGPQQPARLLLVIHHLAVDIVSWSLLLEDLQTAYQQLRHDQPLRLPPKTTSFQSWSERLTAFAQSSMVRSHLDFWLNQPWAEVHLVPLDTATSLEANTEASACTFTIALSAQETQTLLTEVPKAYHTHINDVLLTALVQAFARWTGHTALLIHLEGHGREDMLNGVDLSRTVGWFTTLAPVMLSITENQEPGTALKGIKEQLRRVPQHGLSFGLLRYLSQDSTIVEALASLPQPEISFNYSGRSISTAALAGIFAPAEGAVGAAHDLRGQRPHLFDINSSILDDQLFIEWTYSNNLHHHATIERLAHFYLEALQALIAHCQSPEAGGYTPSDFPDARLTQTALDTLVMSLAEATTTDEDKRHMPNIEAIYPLSPMQEGMLFHRLYDPQSEVYFEQVIFNLHGNLDVPAFKDAWLQVITRHPILRTLFLWEHLKAPLQVVRQHVALPWCELDWQSFPVHEQSAQLQDFLHADRAQNFDLSQAPLLRLNLISLSENTFHFTWSFHHLLLDGWSVTTVLGEVFACYEATRQQHTLHLPPVRPYRDYICWLQQQDLVQAEAFWRETLRGFTNPTPLGVDQVFGRTEESQQDYRDQVFHIPQTTTAALQALARQHQLTLNTLVQGAWALLLAHYSGQQDIVFGTIVSGRPTALPNVEAMVGLFINTLPLRTQVDPQQHLLPWLQALQAQQAEARQFDYTPLVQLQGWSEIPRGQALFESLFVFENYPVDASLEQENSLAIDNSLMVEWTNYPLTIVVIPGTSILLRISSMGNRFETAAIQRLAGHFQALLESMVAQPDRSLADLPFLTTHERQQLLVEWNTPTVSPPAPCLHTLFEAQVARTPDAIALVYEEHVLTYEVLNARANQLAHHLLCLTTPTGEPVITSGMCIGLCLDRSLDLLIGLLAILKAGAAYLPIDPDAPGERISFILADAQAPILLTGQSLADRLLVQHATLLCLDRDWPTIAERNTDNPNIPLPAHSLAYVIYTSGSTGQPKGVLVSHAQVTRLFAATAAQFHFDERDHWTLFHSTAFDFSVWEIWGAFLYGGRLVAVPFWQSRSPDSFAALLHTQAITVLNQTPSAFSQLSSAEVSSPTVEATHLRWIIFGGEALDPRILQPWFERHGDRSPQLVNMYGITETTVHVTAYALTTTDVHSTVQSPIGRPLADLQVYVLDTHMQPVPIGVTGELYVGGAGLSHGYLHRPELTAARFVPHPFSQQPGERLYKTGDLARFLPDGQLAYLGRNDAQVKIRGFRIELGEIEAVLHQHPDVRTAIVIAREDAPGNKRLVAYIVPQQEAQFSSSDLRRHLQNSLPDYMLPAAFVQLDALPVTLNGKLNRSALPAPEWGKSAEKIAVTPRTPTEEILANAWAQVLKIEQPDVHTNFFEAGGDSILSLLVIARVREAGLLLTPKQIFQHQTIAALANVAVTAATVSHEQETVGGQAPLTPIQHWFFDQDLPDPHHWNQAMLLEIMNPHIDIQLLEHAVAHLLEQHGVLTRRFKHGAQGWEQYNLDVETLSTNIVRFVNLNSLPAGDQEHAFVEEATQTQASLNLSEGPLLRFVYFAMGEHPGRLLIVIHHLVIDVVSWRILLEDLQSVCHQLLRHEQVQLPQKTTSFHPWAKHLYAYSQSSQLQQEAPYWLAERRRQVSPLPVDLVADHSLNTRATAKSVSTSLSAEDTDALLHEAASAYHTQIHELLLTALVLACTPWTGRRTLLVDMEGHGREAIIESADLSRTIGWFTSIYPVLFDLESAPGSADLGNAIKTIKEQIRTIPQNGIGYGLLRYLCNDTDRHTQMQSMPQAEISFNYLGQFDLLSENSADVLFRPLDENCGPPYSLRGRRTHLLDVVGIVTQGQFHVEWSYCALLHRQETIETLARRYIETLQALIAHCRAPEAGGYTPSDFSGKGLNQAKVDKIMAKIRSKKRV